MSFQYACLEQPAGSRAQLEALHTLRLAVIGSIGEAAALGACSDEPLALEDTKYDLDRNIKVYRDIDVLAFDPLPEGWRAAHPAAVGPQSLDGGVHAKLGRPKTVHADFGCAAGNTARV
jgi:hypothetical protein